MGFPSHTLELGNPPAKLFYRVIEPAQYNLTERSSNWVARGQQHYNFTFHADIPGKPNQWTASPRGTVILLHGYGLAQFSMAPWALRLAEEGWRCVLVDLRGHGKSTGKEIYFGTHETNDLSRLLDRMQADGELKGPVAAMGESVRRRAVVALGGGGSPRDQRGGDRPLQCFVECGVEHRPRLCRLVSAGIDQGGH